MEVVIKIEVKDNNVDQALKILKRKLQREGFFRILKIKSNYEKPSEKKKRERKENIKRAKKLQRMKNNRQIIFKVISNLTFWRLLLK